MHWRSCGGTHPSNTTHQTEQDGKEDPQPQVERRRKKVKQVRETRETREGRQTWQAHQFLLGVCHRGHVLADVGDAGRFQFAAQGAVAGFQKNGREGTSGQGQPQRCPSEHFLHPKCQRQPFRRQVGAPTVGGPLFRSRRHHGHPQGRRLPKGFEGASRGPWF